MLVLLLLKVYLVDIHRKLNVRDDIIWSGVHDNQQTEPNAILFPFRMLILYRVSLSFTFNFT